MSMVYTEADAFERRYFRNFDYIAQWHADHLPREARSFRSVSELKLVVKEYDNHFFSRDTMTWFKSRLSRNLYGNRFFITSEQASDEHARTYQVHYVILWREAGATATDGWRLTVEHIGDRYTTMNGAKYLAQQAAEILTERYPTTPKES